MAKPRIYGYSKKDFVYVFIALFLALYGLHSSIKLLVISAFIMLAIYSFYFGFKIWPLKEYMVFLRYRGPKKVKGKEVKINAVLYILLGIGWLIIAYYSMQSLN